MALSQDAPQASRITHATCDRLVQPSSLPVRHSIAVSSRSSNRKRAGGGGAPIGRVVPLADPAEKGRERPIAGTGREPVFHGVVVDVIDVSLEVISSSIVCSQNRRCQIPAPRAGSARPIARLPGLPPPGILGKLLLDASPSHRIVGITPGMRPDRMEVIRQDDDGGNVERGPFPHGPKCLPQAPRASSSTEEAPAIVGHDREEHRPPAQGIVGNSAWQAG